MHLTTNTIEVANIKKIIDENKQDPDPFIPETYILAQYNEGFFSKKLMNHENGYSISINKGTYLDGIDFVECPLDYYYGFVKPPTLSEAVEVYNKIKI